MQVENRELKDKLFDQQVKEQVGGGDARGMLIPTMGAAVLGSADTDDYQRVLAENDKLKEVMVLMREKISQLKDRLVKRDAEIKVALEKARNFVKDKKIEWARVIHEKTLKRVALNDFPPNFSAQTLKMHKSNEKMYPMLEHVEKLVLKNVLANMGHVGQAMHSLQDQLKAELKGQWNCLVWRSSCARTAVKFKTPYAQFTGPESLIITVWQT